eukprot:3746576-Pyramimonas_sp.AAC.2
MGGIGVVRRLHGGVLVEGGEGLRRCALVHPHGQAHLLAQLEVPAEQRHRIHGLHRRHEIEGHRLREGVAHAPLA